uniref:SURP motif domain-containing protein n=1 Tax=Brassica oleracea TaxID=3712 RepID=A0A3P6GFK8_BRAOL|nr:unnamed protein product [Brassica oleracea]
MLSSRQNGPIQAPEDPETREIVERTAALVGTHGLLMERRLLAVNVNDERYDFLRSREDHPYYDFYRRKVVEHELTQMMSHQGIFFYLRALLKGSLIRSLVPLSSQLSLWLIYGMSFWRDLIHCVTMNPNPLFEFVKTSDINFSLLLRLVDAYEMALEPYKKSCLHRTNPKETVLEGFFYLVQGEKHSEEVGVQLATIDLHAFVSGLDFIASREVGQLLPPGVLSTQMRSGALPPSDEDDDDDDDDDDDATLEVHHPSPEEHQYYPLTYPQGITPKQLGIIKLTALFLVRYSWGFWVGLHTRLILKPHLPFGFYTHLIGATTFFSIGLPMCMWGNACPRSFAGLALLLGDHT